MTREARVGLARARRPLDDQTAPGHRRGDADGRFGRRFIVCVAAVRQAALDSAARPPAHGSLFDRCRAATSASAAWMTVAETCSSGISDPCPETHRPNFSLSTLLADLEFQPARGQYPATTKRELRLQVVREHDGIDRGRVCIPGRDRTDRSARAIVSRAPEHPRLRCLRCRPGSSRSSSGVASARSNIRHHIGFCFPAVKVDHVGQDRRHRVARLAQLRRAVPAARSTSGGNSRGCGGVRSETGRRRSDRSLQPPTFLSHCSSSAVDRQSSSL